MIEEAKIVCRSILFYLQIEKMISEFKLKKSASNTIFALCSRLDFLKNSPQKIGILFFFMAQGFFTLSYADEVQKHVVRYFYTPEIAVKCLLSAKFVKESLSDIQSDPKKREEGYRYINSVIDFYEKILTSFDTKTERSQIKWKFTEAEILGQKGLDHHHNVMKDCDRLYSRVLDRSGGSARLKIENFSVSIISMRKTSWALFKPLFEYSENKKGQDDEYPRNHFYQMFYDPKSVDRKGPIKKVLVYEIGSDKYISNMSTYDEIADVMIWEMVCEEEKFRSDGKLELVGPMQVQNIFRVNLPVGSEWSYMTPNNLGFELYKILCQ